MTNSNKGLIIVYTGDGKGKTTAALGLALRAAGWGKKVAIIQFIKGYKKTGEYKIIKKIPQIDIFQTFDDKNREIIKPRPEHKKPAIEAFALAKKFINRNTKYDVVILDEINNAMFYDLVEAGEIIKLLENKPVGQTIVLTGRGAPPEIIEIADLVTEMKSIRHPFDNGTPAKKGVDY